MINSFTNFSADTKLEFYKGVSLADGRPAVVGFRRRENENRWDREIRRASENIAKSKAGYSQEEIQNRGDELYSWLSDLSEILDQVFEVKKPDIILCTYSEAQSYAANPQTSLTRSEIDEMRKKYDNLINQKRSNAPQR